MNNILRVSIKNPQGVNKKPLIEEIETSTTPSGTQTPNFLETADEVADSARIVDPETPEPEIADDEAGKIGLRRMSFTPINEVAETSMEVATVAAALDKDEGYSDDDNDDDDVIDEENGACPVFAYETTGPPPHEEDTERLQSTTSPDIADPVSTIEESDFDDPQLESFPSDNRDSILSAMRRISTSIDADRTVIEGFPPSPVVTINQQHKIVSSFDDAGSSRGSVSVTSMDETSLRPEIARSSSSTGSGTRALSMSSLGSIVEDDEARKSDDESDEIMTPFIQHPGPSWGSMVEQAISENDDDEGISMSTGSKRRGGSRDFSWPAASKPITSFANDLSETVGTDVARSNISQETPEIAPGTDISSSNEESETPSPASPDTVDKAEKRMIEKSGPSHSRPVNNNLGWLEACFRVFFVKWLGGLATWLYSRRHRT